MSPLRHFRVRRAGLTLIELVVASVLAAILMVALLGIMRLVAAEKDRTLTAKRHAPAQRLGELLRRDVLHARAMRIGRDSVSLAGFLARDARTRTFSLRPALVTYRVDRAASRLLRQETHLDQVPPTSSVEVMWAGVRSLEITAFEESGEPTLEEGAFLRTMPGMVRVPGQLLVVVRGIDGQPLCREEVVHHAGY